MRQRAVEHAKQSLRYLQEAFRTLQQTISAARLEKAWGEMLHYSDQIYNKLGAAPENGKERDWYNQEVRHRDADELLLYAKHARNAHHHGIAEIAEKRAGGVGICGDGALKNVVWTSTGITAETVPGYPPLRIEVRAETLLLLPVVNRGRTYAVPTKWMEASIDDPTLLDVAIRLEMSMRALVQQAEFLAKEQAENSDSIPLT